MAASTRDWLNEARHGFAGARRALGGVWGPFRGPPPGRQNLIENAKRSTLPAVALLTPALPAAVLASAAAR